MGNQFDGVVNIYGYKVEAFIISLNSRQYPISIKLRFGRTINIVEYETCIYGLEVIAEMKIKNLNVYGDSMLISYQVKE